MTRFPGWAWHTDGEFISPEEYARLEESVGANAGESSLG